MLESPIHKPLPSLCAWLICVSFNACLCASEKNLGGAQLVSQATLKVGNFQQHPRDAFGLEVLELALRKSQRPFVIHTPEQQAANEAHGEHLATADSLRLIFG